MIFGTAVRELDPPLPCRLLGHLGREEPAYSSLDPLTARAVWIEEGGRAVAIVSVDALGISSSATAEIRRRVRETVHGQDVGVMVTATHTHTAPPTMGLAALDADETFLEQVVDAAVTCVAESGAAAAEGRAYRCSRPVNRVAMNRRRPAADGIHMAPNPGGCVDATVSLLYLESVDGRSSCSVATVAVHPTTLGLSVNNVSADYPGRLRSYVEHIHGPDHTAILLQGAAGDAKPLLAPAATTFPEGNESTIDAIGELLGTTVSTLIDDSVPFVVRPPVVHRLTVPALFDFSLHAPGARADVQREGSLAASHVPGSQRDAYLELWQKHFAMTPEDARAASPVFEVDVVAIGPELALLFLPFEPFSETAANIRRASAYAQTCVVGYANGNYGYVPTRREIERGGYECAEAYRYYRMPFPYSPETEEAVREAAISRLSSAPAAAGGTGPAW